MLFPPSDYATSCIFSFLPEAIKSFLKFDSANALSNKEDFNKSYCRLKKKKENCVIEEGNTNYSKYKDRGK